jgi:hypothetical protein
MRLVHIRATDDEDVACLTRELAVYSPKRSRRVVLIELDEHLQTDLLALLSAIETCLVANDIGAVRIAVDGTEYVMESPTTR